MNPSDIRAGLSVESHFKVCYGRRVSLHTTENAMPDRSDKPIVISAPVNAAGKNSTTTERRTGGRYAFTAAAEILEIRSKIRVKGRCSDLSAGGCYIDTISPFTVGAIVSIHMESDGHVFEAPAVVAYAHVQMGMGIAFTEVKRESQAVLRSWMARLTDEPSPELEPSSLEAAKMAESATDPNARLAIHKLIALLVRRKLISEPEGAELLRQMFR